MNADALSNRETLQQWVDAELDSCQRVLKWARETKRSASENFCLGRQGLLQEFQKALDDPDRGTPSLEALKPKRIEVRFGSECYHFCSAPVFDKLLKLSAEHLSDCECYCSPDETREACGYCRLKYLVDSLIQKG